MEFRIAKETFVKALQKVQGIVEKRNTMPILSNVLLEAAADLLLVTATDLEVGMKSSYPVDVVKSGKITVSAKKLYEIIRELPDEQIIFSTKDNDWVEIAAARHISPSSASLLTNSPTFPESTKAISYPLMPRYFGR